MSEVIYLKGQGGFGSMNHLTCCDVCKRKIMVSLALIGVPHHVGLSVVCAECLEITQEHHEQFPEETKTLEEWKNS